MILVVFALREEAQDFARWLETHPSDIRMEVIGVGAEAVARNLPPLLAKAHPERLIAAGYAGALTDELKIGDVFWATNLSTVEAVDLRGVVLHSSSSVVDSPKERKQLATEAGAVDMESAEIMRIARESGVPLLVLRAISDTSDAPLPIPFSVTYDLQRQKIQTISIVIWLLTHPWRWLAFARFLRSLRLARRQLTAMLVRCVQSQGAPCVPSVPQD